MRKIFDLLRPNPFDKLLRNVAGEGKSRFLVLWNRGLGDIPLGLYALVYRIRMFIPNASVTFMTRKDLADTFSMLESVQTIVGETVERGKPVDIDRTLKAHHLSRDMFDVILENPDPTRWLKWQLGALTPKLQWNETWDALSERYELDPNETYIGCHVQTETGAYYGYEKNWDLAKWRDLFKLVEENKRGKILLFGMEKEPAFLMDHVVDLRGETSLFEMLSLIKNRCNYLVAPDSGVLSIVYYVDVSFPIRVASLWADPRQGVLRQRVDSPNTGFVHLPHKGKNDLISNISVEAVYDSLFVDVP